MEAKPPATVIVRTALLNQLCAAGADKLLYLYAPAGYGKSVTAGLWLARTGLPHAAVSLDSYDDRLVNFCRRFCAALAALHPGGAQRGYSRNPSFSAAPDEYTVRVVGALPQSLVAALVIDDLHHINDAETLAFLVVLLKRLPPGVRVMILSRKKPPAAFSDLLVKDRMAVFSAEDLKFSSGEILAFYKRRGYAITKKQAREICSYTDGWAICLRVLILSGGAVPEKRVLKTQIARFIKTQLWDRWDEDTRAFVLATALEEELTPPLCDALTGRRDSAALLERLRDENAFITKGADGAYRFHDLFRKFAARYLSAEGDARRAELLDTAGQWYYRQKRYYQAVDRFILAGNEAGIRQCVARLTRDVVASRYHIEKMQSILHQPAAVAAVEKDPALLWVKAWVAFLDGQGPLMEETLDAYYAQFPAIVEKYPRAVAEMLYIRCIDYRTPMKVLAETLALPGGGGAPAFSAGAITQNMPFFHRSFRDFSEYAAGVPEIEIQPLKQGIGPLLADELEMFEACLLAGLHYEKGHLTEAHGHALAALAKLQNSFATESRFCAMLMLAHVLRALWQYGQAEALMAEVEQMIEAEEAFFLDGSLHAYQYRCRLENGDAEAAAAWLDRYGTGPADNLTFYCLYGNFTSARACITLAHYDRAIAILQKIAEMCRRYRRPLDVIEAKVLLAVAFWKKKRAYQKQALAHLEEAILLAAPYGYTQVFTNEGADIASMLYRLQSRAGRQNYAGPLPGSFTKMLHLSAMAQAGHIKGLSGGRSTEAVKYTAQQKRVMALLCQGCSYRQIGEEMGIQFSTVRSHLELIYKKLDVPNETEAILKIREHGILDDEGPAA